MESGYQTFAENFRECCMASRALLAFERQHIDPDRAAASQECSALYQLIGNKLREERDLIDQFDAAKNQEQSQDSDSIYQQGFQDCVYLLRWIGLLS